MVKLTQEQRDFADEHHNLMFAFLKRHGLSVTEYYDVVVFGYLRAVQCYLEQEHLQQEYQFTTIAWRAMHSAFVDRIRYHYRKKRFPQPLSLDFVYDDSDNDERPFIASVLEASTTDNLDSRLEWMEVSSVLNDRQRALVRSRAQGLTDDEIARTHQISPERVQVVFDKMKRQVCMLLHYDE